jgi:pyridoxamine 5'-phosphate oxidase
MRTKTGNIADPDPFHLFRQWYHEAVDSEISDPTIMSLATAGSDGKPSVRIVLLKEFDERGFVFYTNYRSRKAGQLEENPHAALAIHWPGHQVRIEGRVHRVSEEESDRYFATRLRGSQLGAWASEQSSTMASRESLEGAMLKAEKRFGNGDIPRPPHWGGYRLEPCRIEFWTEREDRLHDRILYERITDGDEHAGLESGTGSPGAGSHDAGAPGDPGGRESLGRESGDIQVRWTRRRLAP